MLELLKKTGALLEGHFLLSSGKHSSRYVQCARLFEDPRVGDVVGKLLADKLRKYEVDIVVGPAMGGVILAYVVARELGVYAMFAERENGKMSLRRGFQILPDQKVAVVEDVVTTGRSVKEVMELVKEMGAHVVCVGSVVDRSAGRVNFATPYEYLVQLDLPVYEPHECPLCAEALPIVKPGSRYLEKNT